MTKANSMHERLKEARQKAGYKTATAAIDAFGWSSSTYRAHENGQNGFKPSDAELYGKAYRVSPSWLLLGEGDALQSANNRKVTKAHKHNCGEHIFAAAMLLKDDPSNLDLIHKIEDCCASLRSKI
jgi:phage repressor protein C with HTH and peptisase S24 domain